MKLFDWLKPKLRVAEAREDTHPRSRDELVLSSRLAQASDGQPFGPDAWSAVERLIGSAHEAEAIDVLRRFIAAQPNDREVTMRLAELLCGRLEHTLARPLLQKLTVSPPHRLRSLLLLAEGWERAGELENARLAYEEVLALDVEHPRARAAADRLMPVRTPRSSAPATLDGPAGVTEPVGGRYALRAELGRGTAGTVYLADDTELDRPIALKLLHPRARVDDGAARLRAWEEARVSAAIRHPGVVAVYDLDEERQLIAMELCEGGSLRARLQRGPLAPREALLALAQLCGTLAAAHERGVVHGDVKPANLLLRRALDDNAAPLDEDELVLCDFGIARIDGLGGPAVLTPEPPLALVVEASRARIDGLAGPAVLTPEPPLALVVEASRARIDGLAGPAVLTPEPPLALVVEASRARIDGLGGPAVLPARIAERAARGTLAYMAPEQRRGVVGAASDAYAAGIVALELFAGKSGLGSLFADRGALLRGEARPLAKLPDGVRVALGGIAARVETLIAALLSEDPLQRPTALEATQACRALLDMI